MSMPVHAFTVELSPGTYDPIALVSVGLPQRTGQTPLPLRQGCRAVWDTGATHCAITAAVAASINAKPVGTALVGGVHESRYCNVYLVSFFLPNGLCCPCLHVTELGEDANCDILIGMDIITKGDFAVTSLAGKTYFTFRIPSVQHIDFARYYPPDDSLCTCGSDKAFQDCCKRHICPACII